jgi:hypothetical protein
VHAQLILKCIRTNDIYVTTHGHSGDSQCEYKCEGCISSPANEYYYHIIMASLKDISAKLLDLAIIMAITFKCRYIYFC